VVELVVVTVLVEVKAVEISEVLELVLLVDLARDWLVCALLQGWFLYVWDDSLGPPALLEFLYMDWNGSL